MEPGNPTQTHLSSVWRSAFLQALAVALTLSTALLFLSQGMAYADQSPGAGASIARLGSSSGIPACSSCHGSKGEGNPAVGYPRLAGLPEAYLNQQLNALASGKRSNPMMTPIAVLLSNEQKGELSAFYATLPAASGSLPATPRAPDYLRGEALALHGKWSENVPACIQCHGSGGGGVGAVFPALAGQSSVYIQNQLTAWRAGTRAPGPLGLMSVVASKLSVSESKAVGDYFAAQPLVVQGSTR
ncbi:c-type cytochrome [Caballeronia sp. DA-9]|uniref:c-type cytochrome n=1 Tax=Caballeronia sp. DA-9 TaxID=3436237 RepID=UPI003F67826B